MGAHSRRRVYRNWSSDWLSCIVVFVVRGRGTPAPFDAPRELVAAGPYRWVRNPMYLGAGMVIVGYGYAFRSTVSVLLLAVAMWITVHLFVYSTKSCAFARNSTARMKIIAALIAMAAAPASR